MRKDVEKNYYIGEGPEADALISEAEERRKSACAARDALQKEYGADGLITRGRGELISGLAFKEKQQRPYLKGEIRLDDCFGYEPRMSCKQGKELAAKLSSPELKFNASDYILGKLKLHRMRAGPHAASRTGMALYYSVAGYTGSKVLVSIPGSQDEDPMRGDKMPEVPAWLRPVKESEWLAAQGK